MRDKLLISGLGIVVLAMCVVAGISIAYASVTSRLDINGYASMNSGNWSVHFANMKNVELIGDVREKSKPLLRDDSTSINGFDIEFFGIESSASYSFEVQNDGSYDAVISSITIPKPKCTGIGTNKEKDANLVCNNIEYTLLYEDGDVINVGDELAEGMTKRLKLTLNYKGKTLPENKVEISGLGITIIYSQK